MCAQASATALLAMAVKGAQSRGSAPAGRWAPTRWTWDWPGLAQAGLRRDVQVCGSACVRPCVRVPVRPCDRVCVRATVRPCVRPCVRACDRATVRPCGSVVALDTGAAGEDILGSSWSLQTVASGRDRRAHQVESCRIMLNHVWETGRA